MINDSVYVGHRIAMEMPVYLIHHRDHDTNRPFPPSLSVCLLLDADLARKARTSHLRLVLHTGFRLCLCRRTICVCQRFKETNSNKSIFSVLYDLFESHRITKMKKSAKTILFEKINKTNNVTFAFVLHDFY